MAAQKAPKEYISANGWPNPSNLVNFGVWDLAENVLLVVLISFRKMFCFCSDFLSGKCFVFVLIFFPENVLFLF